jgi:hypothetical protein
MAKRGKSSKKTAKRPQIKRPAAKKAPAKKSAPAKTVSAKPPVVRKGRKTAKLVVRPRPRGALGRRKTATLRPAPWGKSGAHFSMLELNARDFPDRPAFFRGGESVSQSELLVRCRRLASGLAKAGVERGDTVAILLTQPGALLEALHGVALAGGVPCLLEAEAGIEALAQIITKQEARVLIADNSSAALSEQLLTLTSQKPHMILTFD